MGDGAVKFITDSIEAGNSKAPTVYDSQTLSVVFSPDNKLVSESMSHFHIASSRMYVSQGFRGKYDLRLLSFFTRDKEGCASGGTVCNHSLFFMSGNLFRVLKNSSRTKWNAVIAGSVRDVREASPEVQSPLN